MAVSRLIVESCRRLSHYLRHADAPTSMVDDEMRLVCQRIGSLVGPERVRIWMDELTARTAASLSAGGK